MNFNNVVCNNCKELIKNVWYYENQGLEYEKQRISSIPIFKPNRCPYCGGIIKSIKEFNDIAFCEAEVYEPVSEIDKFNSEKILEEVNQDTEINKIFENIGRKVFESKISSFKGDIIQTTLRDPDNITIDDINKKMDNIYKILNDKKYPSRLEVNTYTYFLLENFLRFKDVKELDLKSLFSSINISINDGIDNNKGKIIYNTGEEEEITIFKTNK